MRKAWLLLGLVMWLGAPSVMASEPLNPTLTPTPSAALSESDFFATVNQTGGYINPSLHQAFWQMMEAKYTPEQRAQMTHDVQQALDVLKAFQTNLWESAKNSYAANQIRPTVEYTPMKARLLQLQSPYFSPKTLVNHAEKILEAAANREAIDLGAGKYYITPELIEENLIGMRGSYERLRLLMTPDWKAEYKEYPLPKMSIALLSLYAPDEYEESMSQDDEKIKLHIAQLSSDPQSLYEIGSVDYQKGNKHFAHFTAQERDAYLHEFVDEQFAGYKIAAPHISKGLWRGHAFVKGVSAYQNYHVVLMCFFVGDKAVYIKHVTDADLSSATTHFNDFTKRLQITGTKAASGGSPLRTYTRVTS